MTRYWVGGGGTWNTTSTAHWATSSGGASGASVPTSSQPVVFNSASGGGTVTLANANLSCLSLTLTGWGGTFSDAGSNILVYGNVNLAGKNMPGYLRFQTSGTMTSGGGTVTNSVGISFGDAGVGTVTLADALTVLVTVYCASSLNTQGVNITAAAFDGSFGVGTITMSSGTIRLSGISPWTMTSSTATLVPGTSTIELTSSTATFTGGGKTYATLQLDGGGTYTFVGSNTFDTLQTNSAVPTLKFTAGTTTTITNWSQTVAGSGTTMTLKSVTDGSKWTLSKASGLLLLQNLSVKDSTATGGAEFVATGSVNAGNNTGWRFGTSLSMLPFL